MVFSQLLHQGNRGDGQLATAETRLAKLEHMEKNLQRLYIEEEISHADFKENRAQIEVSVQDLIQQLIV